MIDYGNPNIELESVVLFWKYSTEDGPFGELFLENISGNYYQGFFPSLSSDSSIEYYIMATNIYGKTVNHPNAGWHLFNTLDFMLGDINQDSSINIQDIILTINFVLNDEYNSLADLNSDGIIDVLDIVQLVNMILN